MTSMAITELYWWPAVEYNFWQMPKCSSCWVVTLISSAVMESHMSVHNPIVLHCIPGISLSLYVSWFCLDSPSAINSCGPGLYNILMLYWWIHYSILCILCGRFITSYKLLPATCDLLSHWAHGWRSSCAIFLDYEVWLGLLFLCCFSGFLHLSGCSSWMLIDQHLMHLFLGIVVLSHFRMPWSFFVWWWFWIFHNCFGMWSSMFIHILIMWTFWMICTPLQLKARIFSGYSL